MEHPLDGRLCGLLVDSKEDLHMEHPPRGRICSFLVDFCSCCRPCALTRSVEWLASGECSQGVGKLGGLTLMWQTGKSGEWQASTRSDDELGSASPGGCRMFAGYSRRPPETPTPTPTRRVWWTRIHQTEATFLSFHQTEGTSFTLVKAQKSRFPLVEPHHTPASWPRRRLVGVRREKVPFH